MILLTLFVCDLSVSFEVSRVKQYGLVRVARAPLLRRDFRKSHKDIVKVGLRIVGGSGSSELIHAACVILRAWDNPKETN